MDPEKMSPWMLPLLGMGLGAASSGLMTPARVGESSVARTKRLVRNALAGGVLGGVAGGAAHLAKEEIIKNHPDAPPGFWSSPLARLGYSGGGRTVLHFLARNNQAKMLQSVLPKIKSIRKGGGKGGNKVLQGWNIAGSRKAGPGSMGAQRMEARAIVDRIQAFLGSSQPQKVKNRLLRQLPGDPAKQLARLGVGGPSPRTALNAFDRVFAPSALHPSAFGARAGLAQGLRRGGSLGLLSALFMAPEILGFGGGAVKDRAKGEFLDYLNIFPGGTKPPPAENPGLFKGLYNKATTGY